MAIELKKEAVKVSESAITAFSQAYLEADVIVPDVKPDMMKVLQIDADSVITNKFCTLNRVTVEGRANLNIMYVGEDGRIKSITNAQPFSHLLDVKGAADGMAAEIQCEIENVEYNIVNSRKLNVRVLIGIDAAVTNTLEVEFPCGLTDDDGFQMLKRCIKPYSVVAMHDCGIDLREKLEMPVGKPCIADLLKTDTRVVCTDIKPVPNKLIVKGMVTVTNLYIGDLDENAVQFAEHEIPFTEIFEIPGIDDTMCADVTVQIVQSRCEITQDADGDSRVLLCDLSMMACCKISQAREIEIIEDIYSTNALVNCEMHSTSFDRIADRAEASVSFKDTASLERSLPEIMQVYNLIAKPCISNTSVEDGRVKVEGVIETYILYLSGDSEYPVYTYKHDCPFCQQIEMAQARKGMYCDVNVAMEHAGYNIGGGWEIELRYIMNIKVKAICPESIRYITGVEQAAAQEECRRRCCVTIYFVKPGDRLWDIAKHYRTTAECIMDANGVAGDSDLAPGRQLIIPQI